MNVKRVLAAIAICVFLSACANQEITKRSDYGVIFSQAMNRDMPFSVYTPPGWTKNEALPLLILLHGGKDDYRTFDKYEVGQYLDGLYSQNALPRVVIAIPDGELGFWENWHDGTRNYRSWVMADLLSHVRDEYNTLPCPDHCFVTGMSMGAHGAMRFADHETEKLGSIAAISGVIVSAKNSHFGWRQRLFSLFIPAKRIWGKRDPGNDELSRHDPYLTWISEPHLMEKPLLLAWGEKESKSISGSNEDFHQHLSVHGKSHSVYVFDGRHLWVDWREPIAQSIRFHVQGKMVHEEHTINANAR